MQETRVLRQRISSIVACPDPSYTRRCLVIAPGIGIVTSGIRITSVIEMGVVLVFVTKAFVRTAEQNYAVGDTVTAPMSPFATGGIPNIVVMYIFVLTYK